MTGQHFAVSGGSPPWFAAVVEMDVITAERDDYNGRMLVACETHKSKDMPRIAAALPKEGPPDVLHGRATKLMCSAYHRTENSEIAKWVYEHNPCSYCRNGAFERLAKLNALTKFQLAECAWDGCDQTRAAARRIIKKRRGDSA